MTDKDALTVRDCLEAYTFYSSIAGQLALSRGRPETWLPSQRTMDTVAEAYLMRSETLTKERA